jgi:ABC-2 type transport system permease protein
LLKNQRIIMKDKRRDRKLLALIQVGLFLGIAIFINILANARLGGKPLYTALDMTEERRYTLTPATRALMRELDDVTTVQVLLEGKFPAGFKRLQLAARDLLDDLRAESSYLEYDFDDPRQGSVDDINRRAQELSKDGIVPVNLRVKDSGETSEKLIYPYAIVYYKGRSMPVRLLENQTPGMHPDVVLNNSVALLEYKFANAIQKLRRAVKPPILFTVGQGELRPLETADLEKELRAFYETGRVHLDSVTALSPEIAALIVAKPTQPFSEKNLFKLDQYVMNGGKVLWLIDALRVDLDSLRGRTSYIPLEYELGLDRLLFQYGIRIRPSLVLDLQCSRIPLATGMLGDAPQFDYFPYPYHPVITPDSRHPIVKGLDAVNLFYPSAIDTAVRTRNEVRKTVLLSTSPRSRLQFPPVKMDFEFLRYDLDPEKFDKGPQPVAMLLEGVFNSRYENRLTEDFRALLANINQDFRAQSPPTRMLVVADGDVARNHVNWKNQTHSPLGYNEFEQYRFANKDFLINAIEYLVDEGGLIEARGKEVKLRRLDATRAQAERARWRLLNMGLPMVFLALFALAYHWLRRRRYAH